MAVVHIVNLSIGYGHRPVLENFNATLPSGEITALVGPSGSGKSTLLSSINRMTDLTPNCKVSGDIQVAQQSVFDSRLSPIELRRMVGMVFQQPTPFPVSIRKNMCLPLRELGLSKAEAEERTESALRSAALWGEVSDRLNAPAMELSGGQQQRLCIARALALEPKVLLLDEPCSALDGDATHQIEKTLQGLAGRVTIVISTHNLEQANRLCQHRIDLGTN